MVDDNKCVVDVSNSSFSYSLELIHYGSIHSNVYYATMIGGFFSESKSLFSLEILLFFGVQIYLWISTQRVSHFYIYRTEKNPQIFIPRHFLNSEKVEKSYKPSRFFVKIRFVSFYALFIVFISYHVEPLTFRWAFVLISIDWFLSVENQKEWTIFVLVRKYTSTSELWNTISEVRQDE